MYHPCIKSLLLMFFSSFYSSLTLIKLYQLTGRKTPAYLLTLFIPLGTQTHFPTSHTHKHTCTLISIAQMRRDDQFALLSDAHVQQTFLPALDHLAHTDLELEGLTSVMTATERRGGGHLLSTASSIIRYIINTTQH